VDWTIIASLGTAGGTLVLAVATFASVRSANRAARAAERSLQAGLRPLLVPSRLDDGDQKVYFEGGQRVITRFILRPGHDDVLVSSAIRHWNVDRAEPR
jgi:hypothetical protein